MTLYHLKQRLKVYKDLADDCACALLLVGVAYGLLWFYSTWRPV